MHARTDGQTTGKHNADTGWADTQKFGSVIDRFVSGISDRNHCSTAVLVHCESSCSRAQFNELGPTALVPLPVSRSSRSAVDVRRLLSGEGTNAQHKLRVNVMILIA